MNSFVFNKLESLAQQVLTESQTQVLAGGFQITKELSLFPAERKKICSRYFLTNKKRTPEKCCNEYKIIHINNSKLNNVPIIQMLQYINCSCYFEIPKYEFQELLEALLYEYLLFKFLLKNAAQVLSVFSVLYRIALSGIPRLLALSYAADRKEWLEYFVTSIPLSANKDL